MKARDKSQGVPAKPKRQSKGKQHAIKAESLDNIADDIVRLGGDPILAQSTLPQFCNMLGHIIRKEMERVRTIVR